jgi:hypothetical protein
MATRIATTFRVLADFADRVCKQPLEPRPLVAGLPEALAVSRIFVLGPEGAWEEVNGAAWVDIAGRAYFDARGPGVARCGSPVALLAFPKARVLGAGKAGAQIELRFLSWVALQVARGARWAAEGRVLVSPGIDAQTLGLLAAKILERLGVDRLFPSAEPDVQTFGPVN